MSRLHSDLIDKIDAAEDMAAEIEVRLLELRREADTLGLVDVMDFLDAAKDVAYKLGSVIRDAATAAVLIK